MKMSDKDERVMAAAICVFQRYGYSRATMSDVAAEAGVSRRTLYSVFPSKAAVLRAAMRQNSEARLAAMREDCARAADLTQTLDIVLRKLIFEPRASIDANPDAADLMRGINAEAQDELEWKKTAYRAALSDVFAGHRARLEEIGLPLERLAGFIEVCCRLCVDQSISTPELSEHADALKVVLRNAIESA